MLSALYFAMSKLFNGVGDLEKIFSTLIVVRRTDLYTDFWPHPVHCRSVWCQSMFADRNTSTGNYCGQLQ